MGSIAAAEPRLRTAGYDIWARSQVLTAPPLRGGVSLGRGFLTQMDDFSKESLPRSSSREIPLWRSSGGRTPYSKQYFPQGIRMPHSVLDENIVKTIGICMFSVTLFEVDPSQKHKTMTNS